MTVNPIRSWVNHAHGQPQVFTPEEARLLIDHLDNVQASSLPADQWRVFRRAKRKLVDIEWAGQRDRPH